MRDKIIQAGVKHLREFGYPTCNAANILTDPIYRAFFRSMVAGTLDDAAKGGPVEKACQAVLAEIDAADSKEGAK